MENKILVDRGEKKYIRDLFGCTYPTVRSALSGKISTALHIKIRTVAKERGGVEMKYKKETL